MGVFHIGYRISGEISGISAHIEFISDTIYNEILITKNWFSIIDIIYLIKMIEYACKDSKKNNVRLHAAVP